MPSKVIELKFSFFGKEISDRLRVSQARRSGRAARGLDRAGRGRARQRAALCHLPCRGAEV